MNRASTEQMDFLQKILDSTLLDKAKDDNYFVDYVISTEEEKLFAKGEYWDYWQINDTITSTIETGDYTNYDKVILNAVRAYWINQKNT